MKLENKIVNNIIQPVKGFMFSLLVYAVLIAAVFFYAGLSLVKLWLLPWAAIVFTCMSMYSAYKDKDLFGSYIGAFNNRLVGLVSWYIELGTN